MFPNLLEEAIEAWTDVRQGVIAEIRNIPVAKLDVRPARNLRTVAELGRHILEVSLMMVGELTREDGDFTRASFPELIAEYAPHVAKLKTRAALLRALDASLDEGIEKFREVGELHMLQGIPRFDGLEGTRFAWMQHGIAQEEYHRGQIAWAARLFGLEPALTKRIRGH